MTKILILFAFLLSLPTFAQSDRDMVLQLDQLQNLNPNPECNMCQKSGKFYTPQEAVNDINSGKLVFLGRDKLPGSDQNYTCIFKSEKAYVLYNNCMGSKKEAGATDIEIISSNGGIMNFYIENNKTPGPISNLTRANYDMTWKFNFVPTAPPGNLNVAGLKNYKAQYLNSNNGSCFMGTAFKAQDMSTQGKCHKMPADQSGGWISEAEKFWREPGDQWPKTKQLLRKSVLNAKF